MASMATGAIQLSLFLSNSVLVLSKQDAGFALLQIASAKPVRFLKPTLENRTRFFYDAIFGKI